jgi:mannose-6-phosphate isomerase-like protein (cupin superfamily)
MEAVKKPWGFEYLLYQNKDVAIWYLHIDPDQMTSLHAHPNKKTGLVLLSGLARVHFLSGSQFITPSDKVMVRHGVFHRTEATNAKPISLLEIETPVDKNDIVRLEDSYGRAGKPYEGPDSIFEYEQELVLKPGHNIFGKCTLDMVDITDHSQLFSLPYKNVMLLEGRLFFQDFDVMAPGDIISSISMSRLAHKFESTPMKIIGISKYDNRNAFENLPSDLS